MCSKNRQALYPESRIAPYPGCTPGTLALLPRVDREPTSSLPREWGISFSLFSGWTQIRLAFYPRSRVLSYPGCTKGRLALYPGNRVTLLPRSRVAIYQGSRVVLCPGSRVAIYQGSRVVLCPGSRVALYPGSRVSFYHGVG